MAREKIWTIKKLSEVKDISDRNEYDLYRGHTQAQAANRRAKKRRANRGDYD